ncbi:MAG: hypothetical protein LBV06_03250 [Propionibacteriaceae bacterium]|nr:hypothetical protein [Propionibacteriaceae bacterium]
MVRTRSTGQWSKPIRILVAVGLALTTVTGIGMVASWAADGTYAHTHKINSIAQDYDANPGDGQCLTTANECTLRAALEEANVSNDKDHVVVDPDWAKAYETAYLAAHPGYVDDPNTPDDDLAQIIPLSTNNLTWMMRPGGRTQDHQIDGTPNQAGTSGGPTGSTSDSTGAVYLATNPVTIDLGGKLRIRDATVSDSVTATLFLLNGASITVTGIHQSWTATSTFYVGPKASSVTIEKNISRTPNFHPERFVLVRGGATDVTIENNDLSGYAASEGSAGWGWIVVNGTNSTAANHVKGVLNVSNNTYFTDPNSNGCDSGNVGGCNSSGLRVEQQYVDSIKFNSNTSSNLNATPNGGATTYTARFLNVDSATVPNLEVTNNTVTNATVWTDRPLFDLRGATVTGSATFSGNTITNTTMKGDSTTSLFGFSGWYNRSDQPANIASLIIEKNVITQVASAVTGTVQNLIDFGQVGEAATITKLQISDNVITGITAPVRWGYGIDANGYGAIRLPGGKQIGSGTISGNTITATSSLIPAIVWYGAMTSTGNTTASHMVIQDNHFDGFGEQAVPSYAATIRLNRTGAVTVQRNTFGVNTKTEQSTPNEESNSDNANAPLMVNNYDSTANAKMNTWFPVARTTSATANVAAVITSATESQTPLDTPSCVAEVEIAPPTDPADQVDLASPPNRTPVLTPKPISVDIFWTRATTAEVLLASQPVGDIDHPLDANGHYTLKVPLPTDPNDSRFDHLKVAAMDQSGRPVLDAQGKPVMVFPAGTVLPVSEAGASTGALRIQTHDPNAGDTTVSSQLSRVVTLSGQCGPTLSLNRATPDPVTGDGGQNSPTSGRNIHFTLESSVDIDPASVAISDFSVEGSTALNTRITSVTPTPTDSRLVFDVVVRADDSGDVTVSLPAGTVTGLSGLTNLTPAKSTDVVVEYHNPLVVNPAVLPVILGEPNGKDYTIGVDPSAPAPSAPLTFTVTPDATGATYQVDASVTATGQLGSDTTIHVSAPGLPNGQSVPAGTVVTLSHTLTTTDQDYVGLVVPSQTLQLFSISPQIRITEAVYTGVTGSDNTVDNITAGGARTPVPVGSQLLDGQPVWFTFTVTNISKDDWATSLTDIEVTDDILGVIDTIPSLARGESVTIVYPHNPVAIHATSPTGGS